MRLLLALLVACPLLFAGASAPASQPPPSCNCAPTGELAKLRDRIAAAPTLDEAQHLAVEPVAQARSVLSKLTWASVSIRDTAQRMADYEAQVRDETHTPAEVADRFGDLVRLNGTRAISTQSAHVATPACNYSTGEIIAIVLGFILAIIPGIILLILLC